MLPTNLGIMFESTPFGFPSNEMLLLKLGKNIVKYYLGSTSISFILPMKNIYNH